MVGDVRHGLGSLKCVLMLCILRFWPLILQMRKLMFKQGKLWTAEVRKWGGGDIS